jgi:hypothetical protein
VAEPCEDGMFSAKVVFSYTVNRRKHFTGQLRNDFGQICRTEDEVQQILENISVPTLVE